MNERGMTGRWGNNAVAKAMNGLPWVLIWSVVGLLTTWAILTQLYRVSSEGNTVSPGTPAVLHLANMFGLAALGIAVRQSLYFHSPLTQIVLLHAFLLLFFQWMVGWSAMRAHSRTVTVAALTFVEGVLSGAMILGLFMAVGVSLRMWAKSAMIAGSSNWLPRLGAIFTKQLDELLYAFLIIAFFSGMLHAHSNTGGIIAPAMAKFLPPVLLVVWLLILHMAGSARIDSKILPEGTPRTLAFRFTIVVLVPVLAILLTLIGFVMRQQVRADLERAVATKAPEGIISRDRSSSLMLFTGLLLLLVLVLAGASFLTNAYKAGSWARYGLAATSFAY